MISITEKSSLKKFDLLLPGLKLNSYFQYAYNKILSNYFCLNLIMLLEIN